MNLLTQELINLKVDAYKYYCTTLIGFWLT